MKLKFFRIDALEPEIDQQELDAFCAKHRLVSIDKQFIQQNKFCYWSVCVTYIKASRSSSTSTIKAVNKRAQIDYREVLNEVDFATYANLRTLRKEISESEGIPVYAIFSNAQLAEMVTKRMTSLSALGEINGVGEAKLTKYGKHFLLLLSNEKNSHTTG